MIKLCPNCKRTTSTFIKGNNIPLVNNFKIDKKLYNSDFYFCKNCDIGFLKYFHPDKKLYNKNYLYSGKFNKSKIDFILFVLKNEIKKDISILEVGGGDGYMGKLLGKNINYTNIDPSSFKGFNTKKKFFEEYRINKKYDIVICLNVLAHVNYPDKIIKKISSLLHKDSKIILSVQNGLSQIKSGYLDNIYHEHKYYYSAFSFRNKVSKIKNDLHYYKYPLHGESILATNIKLKLTKYKNFKSLIGKKEIKYAEKKYNKALDTIKNKIYKSNLKVWGIGCAPRSLKLLYDLKEVSKKIVNIIEPKNSKKLNLKLPKQNIKIVQKNEALIGKKYTILWFPWHINPPKVFKNLIWPYN